MQFNQSTRPSLVPRDCTFRDAIMPKQLFAGLDVSNGEKRNAAFERRLSHVGRLALVAMVHAVPQWARICLDALVIHRAVIVRGLEGATLPRDPNNAVVRRALASHSLFDLLYCLHKD